MPMRDDVLTRLVDLAAADAAFRARARADLDATLAEAGFQLERYEGLRGVAGLVTMRKKPPA